MWTWYKCVDGIAVAIDFVPTDAFPAMSIQMSLGIFSMVAAEHGRFCHRRSI
jgi:hypothetical protein